jgi:hypothetical protein
MVPTRVALRVIERRGGSGMLSMALRNVQQASPHQISVKSHQKVNLYLGM